MLTKIFVFQGELSPEKIYELDIEIWPQSILLPKGFRIALNISGQDFDRPGRAVGDYVLSRGCGPFLHDHPIDRSDEVFNGRTTLYTGPKQSGYLLLPIIPNKESKVKKS